MRRTTGTLVEELIDAQEASLLQQIKSRLAQGMTVAAVAAALSISPAAVQDAEGGGARMTTSTARDNLDIEEILARTIEGEASGEGYRGKHAVASTIWNRAQGKWWNLKYVATAPRQYSIWNKGAPPVTPSADSLAVARQLLSGSFKPSIPHKFFFNPKKVKHTPAWAVGKAWTRIGNHVFVEEVC